MKRVFLFPLIAPLLASGLKAQGVDKYRYLVLATNEAFTLMNARAISLDNLSAGTRAGCKALEMLLEDQNFRGSLDRWAASAKQPAVESERKALQAELGNFVGIFANTEARLLIDAGLTEEAARDIVIAAATLRTELSGSIEPRTLLAGIQALRIELCSGAETLRKAETQAERRRVFSRWAFGIGGVALIAFDGFSSVPTAGIATGSMAIGGAMVGTALSAK